MIEAMIEDSLEHGSHFFDEDTMCLWNSEVRSELIEGEYFITSEDNYDGTKILFSIRRNHQLAETQHPERCRRSIT